MTGNAQYYRILYQ